MLCGSTQVMDGNKHNSILEKDKNLKLGGSLLITVRPSWAKLITWMGLLSLTSPKAFDLGSEIGNDIGAILVGACDQLPLNLVGIYMYLLNALINRYLTDIRIDLSLWALREGLLWEYQMVIMILQVDDSILDIY